MTQSNPRQGALLAEPSTPTSVRRPIWFCAAHLWALYQQGMVCPWREAPKCLCGGVSCSHMRSRKFQVKVFKHGKGSLCEDAIGDAPVQVLGQLSLPT
jgi:hypothetical protein